MSEERKQEQDSSTDRLSDDELLRILESGNASAFPPESVGSELRRNIELKEKFCKLFCYYKCPSPASREKLKTERVAIHPSNKEEPLPGGKQAVGLAIAISSALNIDEIQATVLLHEYLPYAIARDEVKAIDKSFYTSLESVWKVSAFLIESQSTVWHLLQELLRIDSDSTHVYHGDVAEYLTVLIEGGLLDAVLDSVDSLYKWTYKAPCQNDFDAIDISTPDFCHFRAQHSASLAENVIRQTEKALETLVLLMYRRFQDVSLAEFEKLIDIGSLGQFKLPRHAISILTPSYSLATKNKLAVELCNTAQRVEFKWVIVFAELMQYWRVLSENSEYRAHPFLKDEGYTSLTLDSIDTKLSKLCMCDSISQMQESSGCHVISLMWGVYLRAFAANSSTQAVSKYIGLKFENYFCHMSQSLEYLVLLCDSVLQRPTYAKRPIFDSSDVGDVFEDASRTHVDTVVYCLVLQEYVNVLIDYFCDSQNMRYIHPITRLIELIYRGCGSLCQAGFWDRWVSCVHVASTNQELPEQSYPICRLVKFLIETSSQAPQYLISILNALICSTESSLEVLVLLTQQTTIISTVSCSHLQVATGRHPTGEIQWQDPSVYFGQSHKRQGKMSLTNGLVQYITPGGGNSTQSLISPFSGCLGRVIEYSDTNDSCVVNWDAHVKWLAYVLYAIERAAVDFHPSSQNSVFVNSVYLMATLLHYQSYNAVKLIKDEWEQMCFVSYLRQMNALSLYNVLYRMNISVQDMKRDQRSVYESLLSSGVDEDLAYGVVNNAMKLYCPRLFCTDENCGLIIESVVGLVTTLCEYLSSNTLAEGDNVESLHLLAGALYFLRCIVLTPFPSCQQALHVMKAITVRHDLHESQGLCGVLFRVVAYTEGSSGQHMVTKQAFDFFSALILTTQTPLPPASKGLYHLFQKFDIDGNGTISREELQLGLREIGHDVTIGAIDKLFQDIDVTSTTSIHYSQLFQYATANCVVAKNDTNSASGRPTQYMSDIDRAELGLKSLLQETISPNSMGNYALSELVTTSVMSYCMDYFTHMNRWKYTNTCHKLSLAISCVKTFSIMLHNSSAEVPMIVQRCSSKQAADMLLRRFNGDQEFQSALLSACLQLGTSAIYPDFSFANQTSSRSLQAFIGQHKNDLSGEDSAKFRPTVLPVNYGCALHYTPALELELVESLAESTLTFFERIIDYSVHNSDYQESAYRLCELMFYRADSTANGVFGQIAKQSRHAHSVKRLDMQCSYLSLLCAFIDYPSPPSEPSIQLSSNIPQVAVRLLKRFLATMCHYKEEAGSKSKWSFVDGLGSQNMHSFCLSLCEWLKSKANAGIKHAILEVLVLLCTHEPLAVVLLLNVPIDTDKSSASEEKVQSRKKSLVNHTPPERSALVQTIEKLLEKPEDLYEKNPSILHKLLEVILMLIDQSAHLSIGNVVLYLCKNKVFWDHVTFPLMQDLPPPPDVTCSNTPSVDLSAESARYCFRLRIHATALKILARERFGSLFYIDESDMAEHLGKSDRNPHAIAEMVERNVDNFFERANDSSRFLSWVKHYMRVDIYPQLQRDTEKFGRTVGLNIGSLVSQSHYGAGTMPPYGGSYIYSLNTLQALSDKYLEIHEITQGGGSNVEEWKNIIDTVSRLNCMWSIADTQVVLLHNWREFIEVYVQPLPNRPKSYYKYKMKTKSCPERGGIADGEGPKDFYSSDEDIPWAPHSLPLSQSQLSGAQSPTFGSGNSSPSQSKKSSFAGDRRSYELVSEISKQITGMPTTRGESSSNKKQFQFCDSEYIYLGTGAAVEKCNLLVSMLNHQLKQITYRTADPSKSQVTNRNTGSLRLNSKKMIELLDDINHAYMHLIDALTVKSPQYFNIEQYQATKEFWLRSKRSIMLRLLTAQLLLFQALESSNYNSSTSSNVYITAFNIVTTALKEELTQDHTVLLRSAEKGMASQSSIGGDRRVIQPLNLSHSIVMVCFRLLKCIAPRDLTSFRETEIQAWRAVLDDSALYHVILSALYVICEQDSVNTQSELDYSLWDDSTQVQSGVVFTGPPSMRTPLARQAATTPSPGQSQSTRHTTWDGLMCVLDYVLYEGTNSNGLLFCSLLENGLLALLTSAPLFKHMQTMLCGSGQPVHKAAAFMGYNAQTGEDSALSSCWCKVVQIFQCALRMSRINEEYHSLIQSQVLIFIQSFQPLLFLPFPDGHGRFSLYQLYYSKLVVQFFVDCGRFTPSWKVMARAAYDRLVDRVLTMFTLFTALLGERKDHHSQLQQIQLHRSLVAVSSHEKRERSRKTRSKSRSYSNQWDSPSSEGVSLFHSSSIDIYDTKENKVRYKSMIVFLADAEMGIINVLNPCMALLRAEVDYSISSVEGYNIDSVYGKLQTHHEKCTLEVGSRIFFVSAMSIYDGYISGVVHSVDHNRNVYSVRLPDGTIEYDVPCHAISFQTTPPCIAFDLRTGASSLTTGTVATTAHLLQLLNCVRYWENAVESLDDRDITLTNSTPDVDMLCGQLVYVLVMTIALHSNSQIDIGDIRNQLLDIEDIIARDEKSYHWINSQSWDRTREWLVKMMSRILGPTEWPYNVEEEESMDISQVSTRKPNTKFLTDRSHGGGHLGKLRVGPQFIDM